MSEFNLSMLGVVQNIPKVNFLDYSGIILAEPKWGKTTFASMYPDAIILGFEKGYSAQVANVRDMVEWEDFIDFIDKLQEYRKEIGDNVKTIIIDTVNEAHEKCGAYALKVCSKNDAKKYNKPSDVPYGGFYTEWDKQFKLQIQRLLDLGFTILYLSHSKVKTIKPKNGEPYDVYSSTMSDRCEKIIYPAVDYILHGERRKVIDDFGNVTLKRVFKAQGNENAEAGNRVYIDEDIIFDSEEEAFEKFQEKFKASIQAKLDKAGIKKHIDTLAKEQAIEKQQKINEYINKEKQPIPLTPEEIFNQFKSKFMELDNKAKVEMSKELQSKGVTSLASFESVDTTVLAELLKKM